MSGQFGLKLWSTNVQLLDQAEDFIKKKIFDYVELLVVPETDITPFLSHHIPYCIHITTDLHGVNIASPQNHTYTRTQIESCIDWANNLNACYIILHPGVGDINNALDFLKELHDERILIENMPKTGLNGEELIGFSPTQIKSLMGNHFGFCLDLNHAIKASTSLQLPYKKMIQDFLLLQPAMFHISDGHVACEKDEHIPIRSGDYNIPALLKDVRKSHSHIITLETPRSNQNSLNEDLRNLEAIKHFNIL